MDQDYVEGRAIAFAFRWQSFCKPGRYTVTVCCGGFSADNIDAVVDDFGNLVRVS